MSASMGFAGPNGSASAMECTGSAPQSDLRREMKSADAPKRVSVAAAVSLMMGTSSYLSARTASCENSLSYVQ